MSYAEKKITLISDSGEEVIFYVVEETRLAGYNYLLVTDAADDEEDGECYILKDLSKPEEAEALYVIVEDENEIDSLFQIFSQLLEDLQLEK